MTNFYCRECETELEKDIAVEKYNPQREVVICFCNNKECGLFDETIEEAELIDSYKDEDKL